MLLLWEIIVTDGDNEKIVEREKKKNQLRGLSLLSG